MTKEPTHSIRIAVREDVPAIVRLLADDPLGAIRESPEEPLSAAYWSAFDSISEDPNNLLIVADVAGKIAGVLQLTFMPSLTYQGGWRAQIEGVRVAARRRSSGIGTKLVAWAIERSARRGCRLVQLTTDRTRVDALTFYERAGFVCSHYGLKLDLLATGGAGP